MLDTRWKRFMAEMRSTYKSMDTEEKWDIWVVRPIGFVEACVCRRLHIHPNVITVVSIIFGAASGYFFIPGNVSMVLIGEIKFISLFTVSICRYLCCLRDGLPITV